MRVVIQRVSSASVTIGREISGEICVGYSDPKLELIPEEQKMLNEIARILNLALERKGSPTLDLQL